MNSVAPVTMEVDGLRLIDRALQHAARMTGVVSPEQAAERIRGGDISAYLYFRYALAKEAVAKVASIHDGVSGAYLFLENRCDTFPGEPILVGVVVPVKTAALRSLIDAVSEAVQNEVGRRFPALRSYDSLIDWVILDESDLTKRTGVATLLSSVNEPPIQIWPQ